MTTKSSQIEQWYKNPNPVQVGYIAPAASNNNSAWFTAHEHKRSRELSIAPMEYRHRVNTVRDLAHKSGLKRGDLVTISIKADAEKHGQCVIVGICDNYDDYRDQDWNKGNPYLLDISPVNDRNKVISCTIGYVIPADKESIEC